MQRLSAFLLLLLAGSVALAQSPRHILVEKITSVGCPGCPQGGLVLTDLAQQFPDIIPVAIHLNDQWHVDQMATADGDSILAAYWWAQPTALIDRVKFPDQQKMAISSPWWDSKIAERRTDPYDLTLGATTNYDPSSRNLSISLNGFLLNPLAGDLRVNAYIIENSVIGQGLGYDQLNGYNNTSGHPLQGLGNPILGYEHKWVLRDMIGGPWGHAGTISNPAPANTTFSHTFTTTLSTDWDDQEISVVVLVQRFDANQNARTILNSISLGLNEDVLADAEAAIAEQSSLQIYPHPVRDHAFLRLPGPDFDALQLRDLQGRIVWEQAVASKMIRFERGELPSGLYLLEAIRKGSVQQVQKMTLR